MLLASLCIANIGAAADSDFSDGGGILYTEPLKAVIFRHKYHVDVKKLSCEKCHSGLFEMEALSAEGKKDFVMESLYRGKYCGACHNGKDAFASDTHTTSWRGGSNLFWTWVSDGSPDGKQRRLTSRVSPLVSPI